MSARNVPDNLWKMANKNGPVPAHAQYLGSCWVWLKAGKHKYPSFSLGGVCLGAHVYAYMLTKGPIPKGLTIDHLCRNTRCVNPSHLEAVTNAENILRGNGTSARNARKTHCPQGHPYNESNTRYGKASGQRFCKECARLARPKWNETRRKRSLARIAAHRKKLEELKP